jgi:alpha-L-rhamnosidase
MQTQATWMWYPGDFEYWLGQRVYAARVERDNYVAPIWRVDPCTVSLKFYRKVTLTKPNTVRIHAQGKLCIDVDGKAIHQPLKEFTLEAGTHDVEIGMFNSQSFSAVHIDAEEMASGPEWMVSCMDGDWFPAAVWNFTDPARLPQDFRLNLREHAPAASRKESGGVLYDFGKEWMAYLRFKGQGNLTVYYGESEPEALDTDNTYILDTFQVEGEFTSPDTRAFRYVYVVPEGDASYEISMLEEYLPVENQGAFSCDDEVLNKIYEVALHTLHLNAREFLLDGIKRDRWVWSGDATQDYLLNFYSFCDNDICKRTMRLLRGRDPVKKHMNTIQDYTLYWFISLYDYYLYTGDEAFVREMYPKAVSLMDFVYGSVDERLFFNARPYDWVFVDWADLNNQGDISFIQLLFSRALELMAKMADMCGDEANAAKYQADHKRSCDNLFRCFWDKEKGCFTHGPVGSENGLVKRHTNMFAVLFGYLDEEQTRSVIDNALMNPEVPAITTPYMRFYELVSLCAVGQNEQVTRFLREYWGGMLNLGATSFWEEYNPAQTGNEHYAMYGRPYGKSLCHAWGAGPIYLYGRYYLGVTPVGPGYETFEVCPNLGGLRHAEGKVPTPTGPIFVKVDEASATVENRSGGTGTLTAFGQTVPVAPGQTACVQRSRA